MFLWDAVFHPEGRYTLKSRIQQTNVLLDSQLSPDPEAPYKDKSTLLRTSTAKPKPEQGEDEMSTESFPYLSKCRLAHETFGSMQ